MCYSHLQCHCWRQGNFDPFPTIRPPFQFVAAGAPPLDLAATLSFLAALLFVTRTALRSADTLLRGHMVFVVVKRQGHSCHLACAVSRTCRFRNGRPPRPSRSERRRLRLRPCRAWCRCRNTPPRPRPRVRLCPIPFPHRGRD